MEDLFFWLLTVSCSFILVQCFCIGSIRKRNEKYYKPNLLLPRSISSHDFVKLISINGWWVSSQLHFLLFWSHLFCKIKCHMKISLFQNYYFNIDISGSLCLFLEIASFLALQGTLWTTSGGRGNIKVCGRMPKRTCYL